MTRARLGRYALWQLRDYVFERGLPTVLVGLLLGYLSYNSARLRFGPEWAAGELGAERAVTLLVELLTSLHLFMVILNTNGVVSNDRRSGAYRFLFSKPVRVPVFYAQLFAVNAVGLLAAVAVLAGLFWALAGVFAPAGLFAAVLLSYLALGGIVFLFSTLWRFDWLALIGLFVAAGILRARGADGIGHWFLQLLPPSHLMDETLAAVALWRDVDGAAVLWLAGYGAVCFLLGLLVLHKRALAT